MTLRTPCGAAWLQENGLLPRHDPSGGAKALFTGQRATFLYKTRVAIRRACNPLGWFQATRCRHPATIVALIWIRCGMPVSHLNIRKIGFEHIDCCKVSRLTGRRVWFPTNTA
jgi:hypothetical protein